MLLVNIIIHFSNSDKAASVKKTILSIILVCGHILSSYSTNTHQQLVLAKADSLFDAGEVDAAHTLLDEYIALNFNTPTINYTSISQAYLRKGLLHRLEGANHKASQRAAESLKYALLANDSSHIADAYRELGYNHVITGNYQEGLEAYSNALVIDEKFDDKQNISLDINAIGKIYEIWRQYDKALEFFFKSLAIAQESNNRNQVAIRMASIASVYKSQQKFDLALEWLKKSLALEEELGNIVPKGYRLDQIGEVYTLQNQFALAEEYLLQALAIFREHKVYVSESIVLNHLALNHFKKGDIQTAVDYYNQSLAIAHRVSFTNMILKNYRELSQLYEQSGNTSKALDNYKHYYTLKDSVYNERAQKQLMDFQAKYETEQKEKELALLNQEKIEQELRLNQANLQKYLMIGFSIVLIILLGSLLSRFYTKKRTQRQLTEINARLNELNHSKDKLFSVVAHDLRNSIAGFSTIVETLNSRYDSISADNIKHYLGELAQSANALKGMLKNLLEWARSQQNNIPVRLKPIVICEVVDEVVAQAIPMAKLKGITITKQVASSFNLEADYNILETTLRNLLSNALKYSKSGSTVEISAKHQNELLKIIVSDQGVGMTPDEVNTLQNTKCFAQAKPGLDGEKGSGLGLMICKDLLQRISGSLLVESEPEKGSRFIIALPYTANNES